MPSYFIMETPTPINGNKNFRRIGVDYAIHKVRIATPSPPPGGERATFAAARADGKPFTATERTLAAGKAVAQAFKKFVGAANVALCARATDNALQGLCDSVNKAIEEWANDPGRPCPVITTCGGLIMITVTTSTNPLVEGALTFRGAYHVACGRTNEAEAVMRAHLSTPTAPPMYHGPRDNFPPKYTDYYVWQEYGV